MRKNNYTIIASVLCVLLASCSNTYQFYQVLETKSMNHDSHIKEENNELCYENAQCIIRYNFWSNGGTANFEFSNKTDEIIYIDLAKSFFVLNGKAFDLYQNREWGQESTMEVGASMSYGYGVSHSAAFSVGHIVPIFTSTEAVTSTKSSTITIKEKRIIAVPPHSKKYIKTYSITTSPFLSCDLKLYPSQNAKLDFSEEDSPYHFSDIITYTVGNNSQHITINNEFYVSSITNYAEPEIVVMKKREEPCENMKHPDYVEPKYDLFDKYIRDSICVFASSFYNTYDITSYKKLYNKKDYRSYQYNKQYQAYTKSNSNSSKGVVGFAGIMLIGVAIVILLSNVVK